MAKEKKKSSYRTIDLFAGIGGMRLAFENAGFSTVFSNDVDENCKKTYDANFTKSTLHVEDINNLDISEIPPFDVLVAGFPCQAFSIAGYRQGFQDKKGRGNLFFRVADIISERKPRAILLENVKNLKCHDEGNTFKVIKKTLEGLGYHVKSEVLNSRTHSNIPQNRERIFIVGFLDEQKYKNFKFPKGLSLTKNFKEFLIKDVAEKYYYEGKPLYDRINSYAYRGKNYVYFTFEELDEIIYYGNLGLTDYLSDKGISEIGDEELTTQLKLKLKLKGYFIPEKNITFDPVGELFHQKEIRSFPDAYFGGKVRYGFNSSPDLEYNNLDAEVVLYLGNRTNELKVMDCQLKEFPF